VPSLIQRLEKVNRWLLNMGKRTVGGMRNEFTATVERDGRWHIA